MYKLYDLYLYEVKNQSKRDTRVLIPNDGYDIDRDTEQYIERIDHENVQCKVCGKLSSGKAHFAIRLKDMKRHIETHIEGLSYQCPVCDNTFRSKDSLKSHKYKAHKNKPN